MTKTASKLLSLLLLAGLCPWAAAPATAQDYDNDDQLCVYYNGNITYQTDVSNVDSVGFALSKRLVRIFGKNGSILHSALRTRIDSIAFRGLASYPGFNLSSARGITASYDEDTKVYTFVTTNGDPYIYTNYLPNNLPTEKRVFTFEYQCAQGIDDVQLFFGNTISETRSKHVGALPATSGDEWKTYSYDAGLERSQFSWGMAGQECALTSAPQAALP